MSRPEIRIDSALSDNIFNNEKQMEKNKYEEKFLHFTVGVLFKNKSDNNFNKIYTKNVTKIYYKKLF